MPAISKSDVVKAVSDLRKAIYCVRDFSWPLANRELLICASGILLKERKGVLIMGR